MAIEIHNEGRVILAISPPKGVDEKTFNYSQAAQVFGWNLDGTPYTSLSLEPTEKEDRDRLKDLLAEFDNLRVRLGL